MDYIVHGILQARILEWAAFPFSRESSRPRSPHCRQILYQLSHKGNPRILQWVAYPFSRGSSRPKNLTGVSCIAGGFFINSSFREVQEPQKGSPRILLSSPHYIDTVMLDCVPVVSGIFQFSLFLFFCSLTYIISLSTTYATSATAKSLKSCPTVWSHRWQPTRLPCPWDSLGKNTGVCCHFLLQCRKVKSESEVAQSYPTLRDPLDCSLPGSSVHGIFQARVVEWGATAFSTMYNI